MSRKTPAVAYFTQRIRTTAKSKLREYFQDAPLSLRDRRFLDALLDGFTYKELAEKFSCTESNIGKWKRRIFNRLRTFDLYQLNTKSP